MSAIDPPLLWSVGLRRLGRGVARLVVTGAAVALGAAGFSVAAAATVLPGDLDGDGSVGAADEDLLRPLFGGTLGKKIYDPAGDLDADGKIGVRDLAMFGEQYGQSGGYVDTTPPDVFITLNDIPDDENDLLVVPPDGFRITIHFDGTGGSAIDTSSLVVTPIVPMGPFAPGQNLASQFTIKPTRAVWQVPAGSDLERTTHLLNVAVSDFAGNPSLFNFYAFGVRDFQFGAPLGQLQTIFLDFDQERSLGPDVDFLEDLREYGLSSTADPVIEATVRDMLVEEIRQRAADFYLDNSKQIAGTDPTNIQFTTTLPAGAYSRLCVGGESSLGPQQLGAASLDVNNVAQQTDECAVGNAFGVFPQAIDDLWSGNATYQSSFAATDPDLGGTPVGEHPDDAAILAPGFDFETASPSEAARLLAVMDTADAFVQVVATAVAHETGHMLGLTAPGPAPGGLFGGTGGASEDHNVTSTGGTPVENFIMNPGPSFSFEEIAARGAPRPVFRPINWAYLHDRVVLDSSVTGLYLAPNLVSVTPDPAVFGGGFEVQIQLHGQYFLGPVIVRLWGAGPLPFQVFSPVVDPSGTLVTATINSLFVPPGVYDVEVTNTDGQKDTLIDGLEVQP